MGPLVAPANLASVDHCKRKSLRKRSDFRYSIQDSGEGGPAERDCCLLLIALLLNKQGRFERVRTPCPNNKPKQRQRKAASVLVSGEGGIRTLGSLLTANNGLANRRLQPLSHLSKCFGLPAQYNKNLRQMHWRFSLVLMP